MPMIIDSQMASRLAFHRIKARTGRYLHKQIPSRFSLMSQDDTDAFVEAAFTLCQRVELVSEEELRYVCHVMTLFGHRFYDDPRYASVSDILLDTDQQARQRRTQPLVDGLVVRLWGQEQDRRMMLSRICAELRKMEDPGVVYDFHQDVTLLTTGCIRPDDKLKQFFLNNTKGAMLRLGLEGHAAERVCFWTTWILGVDFYRNPQFSWIIRSIDRAGDSPRRRQQRLISWLLRLAMGNGSETMGEIE